MKNKLKYLNFGAHDRKPKLPKFEMFMAPHCSQSCPTVSSLQPPQRWTRTEIDLNRWVKPLTQKSGPVFLHPDEEEWDTRAELHLTGTRHRQTPPNNVTAPWHMRWQNAAVRVFCRLTAACGHDGVIHTKYSVSARAVNEISRKYQNVHWLANHGLDPINRLSIINYADKCFNFSS